LPSKAAKAAVEEAYRLLQMEFDLRSYGTLADQAPDKSFGCAAPALLTGISEFIDVAGRKA
jgi:hypothetical protein